MAMVTTKEARLVLRSVDGDGLRFESRMGAHSVLLDSVPEGAGPSPMDLVLAALGGCGAMDVISILRKKRQPVSRYEVEVRGERAAEHPRVYTRIQVVHRVWGQDVKPAAVQEAIRLSETRYCSVHAMLHGSVSIESRFEILPG